ncbi:MAG: class I SAM-dependent methyltransferase [Cytophagales bacterium]|nr:MAG: class I SAM-dependent methyltransferase [Cytophagales bacterium]
MSWFSSWFDSPFYHVLYKNRNDIEAHFFIDNLISYLNPIQNSLFLDLACGKGRHSIYLNSKGINTDGCDLSPKSITFAKKSENKSLHFFEHDMRENLDKNNYNYILNLFTSFGYFEDSNDNLKMLNSVFEGLESNGIFVLDFFNSYHVVKNLVSYETKNIDNIDFKISKKIVDNFICKNINFDFDNISYQFTEKVEALTINDFEVMFKKTGFKIIDTFGSYSLENYDSEHSNRLIIIAQKSY